MKYVLLFCLICPSLSFAKPAEEMFISLRKQQEALVLKVSNSDTLLLEDNQRIKLIGVESIGLPSKKYVERDEKGNIIEAQVDAFVSLEDQAIVFAQDLLEGKKVRLEYDIQATDANGHRLAYVYLPDGRLANLELLRMGFVHLRISPPNLKYADQLRAAYQEAKREKRGVQGE